MSKKSTGINRSSKFRGVSLNGEKFQVITYNSKKIDYLGSFHDEKLAAVIFDIWQIQMYDLKGKTNFQYTKSMVMAIFLQPNLIYLLKGKTSLYDYFGRRINLLKKE